jgi:hypothetical protein
MLARKPHITVATVGRLLDQLKATKGLKLKSIKFLVVLLLQANSIHRSSTKKTDY